MKTFLTSFDRKAAHGVATVAHYVHLELIRCFFSVVYYGQELNIERRIRNAKRGKFYDVIYRNKYTEIDFSSSVKNEGHGRINIFFY